MGARLLPGADRELVNHLLRALQTDGIRLMPETKAKSLRNHQGKAVLTYERTDGDAGEVQADRVLVALGRRPILMSSLWTGPVLLALLGALLQTKPSEHPLPISTHAETLRVLTSCFHGRVSRNRRGHERGSACETKGGLPEQRVRDLYRTHSGISGRRKHKHTRNMDISSRCTDLITQACAGH